MAREQTLPKREDIGDEAFGGECPAPGVPRSERAGHHAECEETDCQESPRGRGTGLGGALGLRIWTHDCHPASTICDETERSSKEPRKNSQGTAFPSGRRRSACYRSGRSLKGRSRNESAPGIRVPVSRLAPLRW